MDTDAVLKAARQIGDELPYLLGPEADNVAPMLQDALESGADDATAVRVMIVLTPFESTRKWMAARAQVLTAYRGFDPLAGDSKAPPPPNPVFVCAEPGCDCEWVRTLGVGQPIPACHGKQMVPKR